MPIKPANPDKLTPSQELVLELLVVRRRTGETLWTFGSRHTKTLAELEAAGLCSVIHGVVENTVRASLTDRAVDELLTGSTYTSPLERELTMTRGQLDELRSLRSLEADHRSGPTW